MFKTVDKLSIGLDKASLRHNVLSSNLANVNTPGFKRSDVVSSEKFFSQLQKAGHFSLAKTNSRHLPARTRISQQFTVAKDWSTTMRNDGNNVDPDRERILLLANQIYYDTLADAVNRKLGQLRSVIAEGRR